MLLIAQMLLLPLYLWLFLGPGLADLVEPRPFLEAFVALIVIPLGLAWTVQWLAALSSARASAAGRAVMGAGEMYPARTLVAARLLEPKRTSEWDVACLRPTPTQRFSCPTVVPV